MTKNEKQFVVACAIGDGCINKRFVSGYPCYRFLMKHSEKQKDYFLYKAYQLDRIIGKPRKKVFTIYKNSGRSKINAYQFEKNSNKHLKPIYNLLYRNGKKTYSKQLLNMLTPEGLAIWWMDDGSLTNYKYRNKEGILKYTKATGTLNTYISYEENEVIQKYFLDTWDVKFRIHKDTSDSGKVFYRLSASTKELRKLFKIITPYIHKSMKYKVTLKTGQVISECETSKIIKESSPELLCRFDINKTGKLIYNHDEDIVH
jgi:hypothetical protein